MTGETRARRVRRWAAAGLLGVDALSAVVGVASLLPGILAHSPVVIAMVLLRAASGWLEGAAALRLFDNRSGAVPLARTGVLLAAFYATLGIGLRLAPTNLDPSLRLPTVVMYWLLAAVVWVMVPKERA